MWSTSNGLSLYQPLLFADAHVLHVRNCTTRLVVAKRLDFQRGRVLCITTRGLGDWLGILVGLHASALSQAVKLGERRAGGEYQYKMTRGKGTNQISLQEASRLRNTPLNTVLEQNGLFWQPYRILVYPVSSPIFYQTGKLFSCCHFHKWNRILICKMWFIYSSLWWRIVVRASICDRLVSTFVLQDFGRRIFASPHRPIGALNSQCLVAVS